MGKVAPKGQGELTAEERLVIAIFGKKAGGDEGCLAPPAARRKRGASSM